MLSKISKTEKDQNWMTSQIHVESKKVKLRQRGQSGGYQGLGRGRNGEILDNGYKLPFIRQTSYESNVYIAWWLYIIILLLCI